MEINQTTWDLINAFIGFILGWLGKYVRNKYKE